MGSSERWPEGVLTKSLNVVGGHETDTALAGRNSIQRIQQPRESDPSGCISFGDTVLRENAIHVL